MKFSGLHAPKKGRAQTRSGHGFTLNRAARRHRYHCDTRRHFVSLSSRKCARTPAALPACPTTKQLGHRPPFSMNRITTRKTPMEVSQLQWSGFSGWAGQIYPYIKSTLQCSSARMTQRTFPEPLFRMVSTATAPSIPPIREVCLPQGVGQSLAAFNVSSQVGSAL